MFSSKLIVVALWLGAVLVSSTLLSTRRQECTDRDLSDCRGSDELNWYNGCISCAGANLDNLTVDGTCGDCTGAPDPTYCIICTDYTVTYDDAVPGTSDEPPGFVNGDPVACTDGETRNKTLYKCNNGVCTGFPNVVGPCVNDVTPWYVEFE